MQEEPVRRARQTCQVGRLSSFILVFVLFSLFRVESAIIGLPPQDARDPRRGPDGCGHCAGVAEPRHAGARQGHECRGDRSRPAPGPKELLGPPEEEENDPVG